MTDSSDEDYELPNLSERIQALQSKNKCKSSKVPDSETEETEFLKFSERIRNTPCSQVKLKSDKAPDSENEESEFLKFSERIRNTPYSHIKLKPVKASDSENEELEFLKFSEKIRCTPYSQVKLKSGKVSNIEKEESGFLKLSERIHDTPCSQVKCKLRLSSGSEDEESERLKFSDILHNAPQSQSGLEHRHEADDSDSDDVFSNLAEKFQEIQTTKSENKKYHHEESDSDSDGSFSNFITKVREINTPKPQNRRNTDVSNSLLPNVSEKQRQPLSAVFPSNQNSASKAVADIPRSYTIPQSENAREYASLFPARSDDSLFCKKRAFYTKALFEFFNRKIFIYKLPKDLPLLWDGSLVKTAGLTVCKAKGGVYTCSIKLSTKLLTSFDRLQDTLLHEMCHAAVWVINKKDVNHGPLWQIWASRCKLILPFVECPARCHDYEVPYRFWYQCPKCQWRKGECRRSKKYHGAVCKKCKTPITMTVNK